MMWRHHRQQVASQKDHDLPCSAYAGVQTASSESSIADLFLFRNNNFLYTALPALGSRVFRRNSYHLRTCTCVLRGTLPRSELGLSASVATCNPARALYLNPGTLSCFYRTPSCPSLITLRPSDRA
jgi:hypothetical protein